jgi:hypothetical protein
MPAVLCGLKCFDVPVATTASGVAREFFASLNPALNSAGCAVDVYRLELVQPDVQLSAEDLVVCSIPGWQFDFAALEDLHHQFEELRLEHDKLLVQYSRTKEALMACSTSNEVADVVDTPVQRRNPGSDANIRSGNVKEVEQLKMQLTQSEKKQQETKATVLALRKEFMQLVDFMHDAGGGKCYQYLELPNVASLTKGSWPPSTQSPQPIPSETDRPNSGAGSQVFEAAKTRHGSQPPMVPAARRPIVSPRVHRPAGVFSTPRTAGARPRGVHQRGGHSAGASIRLQ